MAKSMLVTKVGDNIDVTVNISFNLAKFGLVPVNFLNPFLRNGGLMRGYRGGTLKLDF